MATTKLIDQYTREAKCKARSVHYSAMALLDRVLSQHEDWDVLSLSEMQWREILDQLHTEENTRLIRYRTSFYRFFLWCGPKGESSLRSLERIHFAVGCDIDFPVEEYFASFNELMSLLESFKDTRWYGVACGLLLIWYGYELEDLLSLKKEEVTFNEDLSVVFIRNRAIRNQRASNFLKGYKEAASYLSQHNRIRTYCFTNLYFRSTRKPMDGSNFAIALNEMNAELSKVGRRISTKRLRDSSQFVYTLACCEHDGIEIYATCQQKDRLYFAQRLKKSSEYTKYDKINYLRDEYAIFYEWCKAFYPDSVIE